MPSYRVYIYYGVYTYYEYILWMGRISTTVMLPDRMESHVSGRGILAGFGAIVNDTHSNKEILVYRSSIGTPSLVMDNTVQINS